MNFLIDNNNNVMWAAGSVCISFFALILSGYSIYNSNKQNKKNRMASLTYKRRLDELTSLKQNVLEILEFINEDESDKTNLTSLYNKLKKLKASLSQLFSTLNREEQHVIDFSLELGVLIVDIASFEQKSLNTNDFLSFMADVSGRLDIAFKDYEVEEEKEINTLL
ncbi:hypothetical protein [Lactococcus formosensis]|uniref:hypothetical protein n=1 Tax=Lactococcus formosensis TaxID=1281486 RepID=UPI00254CD9AC|nr:hypothetical protein [Lactococcus formosensis]